MFLFFLEWAGPDPDIWAGPTLARPKSKRLQKLQTGEGEDYRERWPQTWSGGWADGFCGVSGRNGGWSRSWGKEEGFCRVEREEETVTISGVRGGRLVVGLDTCGGAGGGSGWWLERRGGGEKLLERGLWKLVFCQLWTLFSPPPGHQTHLYL